MDDSFDNWLKEREAEADVDDGRLSVGTVIGAYRIETFLGKGGFAEVYAAKASNGERVAIKILHRLDEQSRMRFERESNILSQIHHPNIPKLLSFGSCGNRPYLVTEMLQAKGLPHTDKAVARFVRAVCRAADALHKMGYIHRDIKPSNVLWRGDIPVLIDFGLACPKSDVPRSPSTISLVDGQRIVVGTVGYAAPEQFAGGKIDETTDVHAIGMLADACFNGHPPRCWRKIIDRATNSRGYYRFPSASALSWKVALRHVGRWVLVALLTIAFAYNLFVTRQGFSSVMYGIGTCLATIKQSELAARLYSFAATLDTDKWDNGRTFVALGDCYAKGLGVWKDYNAALGWYRKATARNIVLATQKETNLFAVATQETLQRYFAIPESMVQDEGDREAGYELLGEALGDALRAVVTNETAKVDLARVAEKSGYDSKQSDRIRFLLHQGSFGLYIDSGETNQAKRVLIDMWRNHHDKATKLLEMVHNWKVDFGIKCKDPNCPLLFKSLMMLSGEFNRFNVHRAKPKATIDINELEFGESSFAQDAEFGTSDIKDPIEVWHTETIPIKWKTVRFTNPGWSTISAELHFTRESSSLFEIVFYDVYDSTVSRETAFSSFKRIAEFIDEKFGAKAKINWIQKWWLEKCLVECHAKALRHCGKLNRLTFRFSESCRVFMIDEDDGVGDARVDGEVWEDPHNCKSLQIRVCNEVEKLKAWKEDDVHPWGVSSVDRPTETSWKSTTEFFLDGCRRGYPWHYLGALGRAYDRGCYGVESNHVKSVLFYSLASSKGNNKAEDRLMLGECGEVDLMPSEFWDVRSKISSVIDQRDEKLGEEVLEILHRLDNLPPPAIPDLTNFTSATNYLLKINCDLFSATNMIDYVRTMVEKGVREEAEESASQSDTVEFLKRAVVCDSQGNMNEWYYDEMDNGIRLAGLTKDTFAERLEIPDKIGGKPVVSIGAGLSKNYLVKEVSVPASVTEVGEHAFYNWSSLCNIKLPVGLKNIGPSAFEDCSSLEEIEIPVSVEVIGHHAFANTRLRAISIPDSVREFGEDVFQLCDNLTNIHFGAGIKSFRPNEFCFLERLQEVNMPPLVDEIEKWGFLAFSRGCRNLERIRVDPGNKHFSEGRGMLLDKDGKRVVFSYGSNSTVVIPEGVEEISDEAFSDCDSIEKVVLPKSLHRIGKRAFSGCDKLMQLYIPGGVEKIGADAFGACDGLRSVEVDPANKFYASTNGVLCDKSMRKLVCVPRGMSTIQLPEHLCDMEESAFCCCENLKEFSIPEGVIELKWELFRGCTNLTVLTIPKSVIRIAPNVFYGCRNLKSVTFLGDAPEVRCAEGTGMYAGHVWDVTTYVTKESKGWGVDIPGMWQKRPIRYVQERDKKPVPIKKGCEK